MADLTLHSHKSGYSLTDGELLFSTVTVSGAPYAKRHWELSDKSHFWEHRIIAVLECVPVLGALVALIERVIALFFEKAPATPAKVERAIAPPPAPWKPRLFTVQQAFKKMIENAKEAVQEHVERHPGLASEYASAGTLHPLSKPLTFSHEVCGKIGARKSMEDAHFYREIEQGTLVGIFDGHAGKKVAEYACNAFQTRFSDALKKTNGHVLHAFETLFYEVNGEILSNPELQLMGSTAVISFINKTGMVFTATLADSESTIYRDGKAIPLSCIRDWKHPKEVQRAYETYREEGVKNWPKALNPKYLRVDGLNVSRALGDKNCAAITAKPKVTVAQMKPGDRLVLACDGLKDYVDEREMNRLMNEPSGEKLLAEKLVDFALNEKESKDNVTVLVLTAS